MPISVLIRLGME